VNIVIDTNILISFLFWNNESISSAISEAMSKHRVLRSTESFSELSQVVMRPAFDRYLSVQEREVFLALFQEQSHYVLVEERINACRDPKDNKFLELAMAGQAHLILTGDQDLLTLDPFHMARILSPKNFLSLIRREVQVA